MSYWGSDNARVQILDSNDDVTKTYDLPATNDRNKNPYELIDDSRINPITKVFIQRRFGFRPIFKYFWIFDKHEKINQDLRDLITIANTEGYVKLYPHIDISWIWYYVYISDIKVGYSKKTTQINEIEIEFTGKNLIDEIPLYNPYITVQLENITIT